MIPTEVKFQVSPAPESRLNVGGVHLLKAQRVPALDFTKGTLVLIMVLYHWINYFIGPQWRYFEYLRFLSPSFICISGFLISNVYLSRHAAAAPRLSRRLLTRGLKLLAIFFVLNLLRIIIVPVSKTGVVAKNLYDFRSLFRIFISGNFGVYDGKLISFSILVPISYMLILSGALIRPHRSNKYTFHLVCLLLLLSISTLRVIGVQSGYVETVTIGILGVLTGFSSIVRINNLVRHPYLLAFAYLCYTIAITIWKVPFPLLIAGVFLSLAIIYLVGTSSRESGKITSEVILLGKYSLFGYISQIAILQLLSAAFHHVNLGVAGLGISLFAALALTLLSVEAVDRGRARVPRIDRLYRAVFS